MGGGSSSISNIAKRGLTFISGGIIDGGGTKQAKAPPPTVIHTPAPESGGPKENLQPIQAAKAPKPSDAGVSAAKKKQSRIAAAAGGRARNILTSGRGLDTEANTTKKTLLGQ